MARTTNPHVALLSIHPEYARGIIEGRKTVEFRRRAFGKSVTHVVVYATAPVRKVIGAFTVADIEEASPRALWERHGLSGLITRARFFDYFSDVARGFAIVVGEVIAAPKPLALGRITGRSVGPQSFEYLAPGVLSRYGLAVA